MPEVMGAMDAAGTRRAMERRILLDIIWANPPEAAAGKVQDYIDQLRETYHSAIKLMAKDSR